MLMSMEKGVMRRLEKTSLKAMKEKSEQVLKEAQARDKKFDYTIDENVECKTAVSLPGGSQQNPLPTLK